MRAAGVYGWRGLLHVAWHEYLQARLAVRGLWGARDTRSTNGALATERLVRFGRWCSLLYSL